MGLPIKAAFLRLERTVNPVAVHAAHHGCQYKAATGEMPKVPMGAFRGIKAILFESALCQGNIEKTIIPSAWEFGRW